MRALSLPRSLFAGAVNRMGASRSFSRLGVTTRIQGFTLGDAVVDPGTGEVIGDTGDTSTLPLDFAAGVASGKYVVNQGTGASPISSIPGSASGPASWLSSLTSALPSISSFVTAEQLAQVNISRARQGLPALQTSQYAPSVGVTVAPNTTRALTIGAIAVAAVLVLPRMLRGRRR